jgi:uncharacterized repeat protein (TIGR01451 family)
MKQRLIAFVIVLVSLLALFTGSLYPLYANSIARAGQDIPWQEKVDPLVIEESSQGPTEFLVYLSEQADLSAAQALTTKLDKGVYVYKTLTELAKRTQPPIIQRLKSSGLEYRAFWIANMIWVRGDLSAVQWMAQRSDVSYIYANPTVHFEEPLRSPLSNDESSPAGVEWNITKVGAPLVWAAGFTGQGVVVGGQDTGYEWGHPALINHYRGWNGTSADHDYSWHDAIHSGGGVCGPNSPQPCDDNGHGTHTMGTMVGDDGGSNQIGMAPGAKWIGCRNMDRGNGTPATYIECYEWFTAPYPIGGDPLVDGDPGKAPDVINNSWGCPPSEGCNWDSLLGAVNAVHAAGIVTVHSAGNSGPSCSTVDTPAAIYEASFSVGATDNVDNIAGFSSRGPVTIDGSNRLKPDVSAPGVNIRSSVPGGGYAGGWSGTSMAAPHVAGLVALIISAQPHLAGQVDQIETLIEQNALPLTSTQTCGVPGSNIPNNTFGWGRVDAWAAVQGVPHGFDVSMASLPPAVRPGGLVTYNILINHLHPITETQNVVLTDTLPVGTSFFSAAPTYTINGVTIQWIFPSLGANASQTATLVVYPPEWPSGSFGNLYYGVRSDEVPQAVMGPPVYTLIGYLLQLPTLFR